MGQGRLWSCLVEGLKKKKKKKKTDFDQIIDRFASVKARKVQL